MLIHHAGNSQSETPLVDFQFHVNEAFGASELDVQDGSDTDRSNECNASGVQLKPMTPLVEEPAEHMHAEAGSAEAAPAVSAAPSPVVQQAYTPQLDRASCDEGRGATLLYNFGSCR